MAKKVAGQLKLQVPAGAANPSPPIGPALGQRGQVIPVEITVYEDRSFTFITKTPPAAKLILKAAGVPKGSGNPLKPVASITKAQVRTIAEAKMQDLNAADVEGAMAMVEGSARSMGLEVTG